jgi:uncharacterized membrane protein
MKKIITLLMLMILLTSHSLYAQTKDTYLLKSKHQKTAAWIMLGGGTTLLIVGGIVAAHGLFDIFSSPDKASNNPGIGGILGITGVVAMLGSIPLFIASSKNKHKAMSLTFANQPLPALVRNITRNKPVTSISLQFNL